MESCLDCNTAIFGPNTQTAAICVDTKEKIWGAEPISKAGWWLKLVSEPEVCEAVSRPNRELCPSMLPCTPSTSCTGANTCAEGYTYLKSACGKSRKDGLYFSNNCTVDDDCMMFQGEKKTGTCSPETPQFCTSCIKGMCTCQSYERCAMCTVGTHFREDGDCSACPALQWYHYVMMVVGFLVAAYFAWKLTQSGVSMALANITIDYFQVLSMFRKSKISWPEEMKQLFKILSIFNFNLDLLPPECSLPKLDYKWKWLAIEAVPLAAGE